MTEGCLQYLHREATSNGSAICDDRVFGLSSQLHFVVTWVSLGVKLTMKFCLKYNCYKTLLKYPLFFLHNLLFSPLHMTQESRQFNAALIFFLHDSVVFFSQGETGWLSNFHPIFIQKDCSRHGNVSNKKQRLFPPAAGVTLWKRLFHFCCEITKYIDTHTHTHNTLHNRRSL